MTGVQTCALPIFYNLEDDLAETTDLMKTERDVAAKMSKQMRTALDKAGAQMPLDPKTKQPVPLPDLIK